MAETNKSRKTTSKPAKPTANKPTFAPDQYDPSVMDAEYGFVGSLIKSNPEIEAIHTEAANNGWFDSASGVAKYKRKIQETNWYQENNQYARAAYTAFNLSKEGKGADWQAMMQNARLAVEDRATAQGAKLTDTDLENLSRQYIYQGWGKDNRGGLMDKALADYIGMRDSPSGDGAMLYGSAGDLSGSLRRYATDNGIEYSDSWYTSAAQSVARNLTTEEDWLRDIEEKAVSRWPVFAKQIQAGMTAKDLASPYKQIMSRTFEISDNDIDIDDPYIRGALGGFDDSGSPKAMNLWDFEQQLRNDPRWANTKQALDQTSSVASSVLKMFGFRG
jgi:hypothetical protein